MSYRSSYPILVAVFHWSGLWNFHGCGMVYLIAGHMVQSNSRIFKVLSDHATGKVALYRFFRLLRGAAAG